MQCTTKGHFGSFTPSTAAHLTQTNRMATDWTGSMGTNLKWADLSEASFNHAQMEAARLRDALLCGTIMPNGMVTYAALAE
jgi:uncharacterized protein YjbI with pentapeptide repeats